MSRISYVNGRYVPHHRAGVSVDDRGFLLADGVYEVIGTKDGQLVDELGHLRRLRRSLGELEIHSPMDDRALGIVIREVVRRNHVFNGIVYLQITRGAARRDHGFPVPAPPPTLLVSARELSYRALAKRVTEGVRVNTHLDFRWGRCDIKSIALLPNVLAKEAAREAGAFEAWFVDSTGIVTEGASSNAWIVDKAGVIRTRQLDHRILGGITRQAIVNLAIRQGWKLEERGFSVEEAKLATEAFLSSSTNPSIGVTSIDGVKIGDGRPGPVTKSIYEAYKSRTL